MLWIYLQEDGGTSARIGHLIDGALSLVRQHAKAEPSLQPSQSSFSLIEGGLVISAGRFVEAAALASLLLFGFVVLLGKAGTPSSMPDSPESRAASPHLLKAGFAKMLPRPAANIDHRPNAVRVSSAVGTTEMEIASRNALMDAPAFQDNLPTSDQQHSPDPTGTWQGTLPGERPLRFVLKISKTDDGKLKALFYSIDRSGQALPATEISNQGAKLDFALGSINASFKGVVSQDGNSITGRWTQSTEQKALRFERASEQTAWAIPAPPTRHEPKPKDSGGSYEVATVKPSPAWDDGSGFRVRGRTLESVNTSLGDLLQFGFELQAKQIVDGPDWIGKDKFDIEMLFEGKDFPNDTQCKSMVRQVLAERFGLKFHRETKELPVYALVVAKSGPKLTKSEGDPNGLPGLHFSAPGVLNASNATMSDLAGALQRSALNRPVTDQTGLVGRWDFGLDWTPDETQFSEHTRDQPLNPGKPDLNTAIQAQLGLKLEAVKATAGTLIIDHVAKPSGN
jgi:uncharacterized protein (TIGR03435 family)